MLISTAYAQAATTPTAQDGIMAFVPLLLVLGVFYFLVMRPQAKRAREHEQLLTTLRRGDIVLTTGGFKGRINKVVDDSFVELEITEGQNATLLKSSVVKVITRATEQESEKPKERAGAKADKPAKKAAKKSTKKK